MTSRSEIAATERLEEQLGGAVAELAARYREVLPVEAVAEVVHAAHLSVADAAGESRGSIAADVIARARAELALVVGAPVPTNPAGPISPGPASAWTHFLDGTAVVRVVGEFDLSTAAFLRLELGRALESTLAMIIVDLGRVTFMDLAGLAPLRRAAVQAADDGRRLLLVRVPAAVSELIAGAAATDLGDNVATTLADAAGP
jgi:anti-sigma B factor antagonist